MFRLLLFVSFFSCATAFSQNWPTAAGPNGNWKVEDVADPPTAWSVVRDENILWRTTLPEGGQSAVTLWGDRAFVTTHRPISEGDPLTEPNVVGYCLDAATGEILWQCELPGTDPVQTAGIFSDGTVFAPVTDGEHVWFFNRCGSMGCFDFKGEQIWLREYRPRARHTNRQCEPILHGGLILTVEVKDKEAGQKLERHKPVPEGVVERDVWTYLHAIDKNTGEVKWIGEPGTSVHNTPMIGTTADGRAAVVHGRGGGHGPLETPFGISMTLVETGENLWNYETGKGGDCYFNSHWNRRHVYWFHRQNHLVLDATSGKLLREQNVINSADFCRHDAGSNTWTLDRGVEVMAGKKQPITNQTNIVVGDWHYFLAHDLFAIGRVHVESGKTEYLQLPAQLQASNESRAKDRFLWTKDKLILNDTKNSREIDIAPDKRARNSGWGHVSAASPIQVNQYLYVPIMNGTVYVIDTGAETFDQNALVAVNDLGPAGETWTLASFSYAEGKLYMHTMKEVICIGHRESAKP